MDCLVYGWKRLSSTVHWRIQPFVKRNIKSLPADFAVGWRQAILGKDQRARIVHRGMRVELGRIGKARPIEHQAVCLGFFGHPNERDVSKFSSDVATPDVRMSSREPDLLDLRARLLAFLSRASERTRFDARQQPVRGIRASRYCRDRYRESRTFHCQTMKKARREFRGHQRCPIRQET